MPTHSRPRRFATLAMLAIITTACGSAHATTTGPASTNATRIGGGVVTSTTSPAATPTTQVQSGTTHAGSLPDQSGSTIPSTAPPTTRGTVLSATKVPPALQSVASAYLKRRENAIAYYQSSPVAWVATERRFMTSSGYKQLVATTADTGGTGAGFPYLTAHHFKWEVRVSANCSTVPDSHNTNTSEVVGCELTDTMLGESGAPVPTSQLPNLWPYNGPQPQASLAMVASGSTWLVQQDLTGQVP